MTDRYENIRKALEMLDSAPADETMTLAAARDQFDSACDPDAIRELLAERDSLAEGLSDTEKDVAVAQAVEFAEYVERQAKGAMRDTAKRFLSLPYSQEVAGRMKDALRYRWLRTKLMAANFHPEDPNGLDLGEGVALIFLLPSASRVTPDLDWTIDQARGKENGND